jgi:S-adenosylmethionine synthetase
MHSNKAEEVIVRLAYAIGIKDPVMAMAIVDGQEMDIIDYDLSPAAMKGFLKLNEVKFAETAPWGHFGRGFSWDK